VDGKDYTFPASTVAFASCRLASLVAMVVVPTEVAITSQIDIQYSEPAAQTHTHMGGMRRLRHHTIVMATPEADRDDCLRVMEFVMV
jgi:hypothetical protein